MTIFLGLNHRTITLGLNILVKQHGSRLEQYFNSIMEFDVCYGDIEFL